MTQWKVEAGGDGWWVLTRTGLAPARRIEILFEGVVDGRRWTEGVSPFQRVVRPGQQIRVHILHPGTASGVAVRWRSSRFGGRVNEWSTELGGGRARGSPAAAGRGSLSDLETFLGGRSRLALLTIDRETMLPLNYEYDGVAGRFRSLGYVRVGAATAMEVSHDGPDTPAVRDVFLTKALVAVAVPARRAADIVRRAEHGP